MLKAKFDGIGVNNSYIFSCDGGEKGVGCEGYFFRMGVGTVVVVQINVCSDYFRTSRGGLGEQSLTCINYGVKISRMIGKYFVKNI